MAKSSENQVDTIYDHLQTYGSITSLEAITKYGITRISSVIHILRHQYSLNIKTKRIKANSTTGKTGTYGEYILNPGSPA